jgi:hypothetical protein
VEYVVVIGLDVLKRLTVALPVRVTSYEVLPRLLDNIEREVE